MLFFLRSRSYMLGKVLIGVLVVIFLVNFLFAGREERIITVRYTNPLLKDWNREMLNHMNPLKGNYSDLWHSMPDFIKSCEEFLGRQFNVVKLVNKDEKKFHILPKKGLRRSTVLTIGVGNDVEAEKQLKALLKGQVDFFGADPMTIPNQFIYSDLGPFFPFAVGADTGMSGALVLQNDVYVGKTVLHIDFIYYLTKMLKRNFIDALWLDAENAEYDMFPMFARGGALDQNNITICQINVEIHIPDSQMMQKAHNFFFEIVNDQRYAIINAVPIGHMRIYMVNMENPLCLRRFQLDHSTI